MNQENNIGGFFHFCLKIQNIVHDERWQMEKFSYHHLQNYPLPNRTINPPKMKIQDCQPPQSYGGAHVFNLYSN